MARQIHTKIPVRGHYQRYTIGSYPGPYKVVRKWKEPYNRKHTRLIMITQKRNVKDRFPSKTMTKEIPQNLLDTIKTLVKDQDHEYSIDIDFERHLETPEQMLVMKGGKRETIRVGDFELFGHTHPNQKYPYPSNTDLKILRPLRPEFIVAQSGKAIIMNIEDYDVWRKFKESNKKADVNWIDSQYGRDRLFNQTGVRIYPFVKSLKIEVRDDPHPEKRFPRASPITLSKWHTPQK